MSLEISRLSREKAYLVASNKALTEQLQNAKEPSKDTGEQKPKKPQGVGQMATKKKTVTKKKPTPKKKTTSTAKRSLLSSARGTAKKVVAKKKAQTAKQKAAAKKKAAVTKQKALDTARSKAMNKKVSVPKASKTQMVTGTYKKMYDDNKKALSNSESTYKASQEDYKKQVQAAQDSYNNSTAKADAEKWANASVQDIASKYGFDYSREYAKRQAEAEAQAKRNANSEQTRQNDSMNKLNTQNIDNNLMTSVENLDRNYFQKALAQQQSQVNGGMNGGIAADQDLRMAMARQADMAGGYRDANLAKATEQQRYTNQQQSLIDSLGLINQQALAREDSLYNDRLQQGYENLSNDRNFYQSRDNEYYNRMNTTLDRLDNLDQNAYSRYDSEANRYTGQMNNAISNSQWQQEQEWKQKQDIFNNNMDNTKFVWDKTMDVADRTGSLYGRRTLAGQQFDWDKTVDKANMTGYYNKKKTVDYKNQLFNQGMATKNYNLDVNKFNWQKTTDNRDYALQKSAISSRGGGGSGGGRSGGGGRSYSGGSSSYSSKSSGGTNGFKKAYNNYKGAKTPTLRNSDVVTRQKNAQYKKTVGKMPAGSNNLLVKQAWNKKNSRNVYDYLLAPYRKQEVSTWEM